MLASGIAQDTTIEVPYAAAMTSPVDPLPCRGDVNSLDFPASPEAAIFTSASALSKSMRMYKSGVKIGQDVESGSSENKGSSNGAWW